MIIRTQGMLERGWDRLGAATDQPLVIAWWSAWGGLSLAAAGLLARRATAALSSPPSSGVLLAVAVSLIGTCLLLRGSAPALGILKGSPSRQTAALGWLTICCLLLMVAVTLPGAPTAGLLGSWSCVVAVEASWWTSRRRLDASASLVTPATAALADAALPSDREPAHTPLAAPSAPPFPTGDSACDEALPADITHCFTRRRNGEWGEVVCGSLRVPFAPGERTQAAHVAFCPPLVAAPEICAEPAEGCEASIDVLQAAPYGARLEVRLDQAATDNTDVIVHYEALCTANPGQLATGSSATASARTGSPQGHEGRAFG